MNNIPSYQLNQLGVGSKAASESTTWGYQILVVYFNTPWHGGIVFLDFLLTWLAK